MRPVVSSTVSPEVGADQVRLFGNRLEIEEKNAARDAPASTPKGP
jgi:hypothetical protein